jgi:hypothetical protein
MPVFPFFPVPSSTSAPAVIDPMHIFESDAGPTLRRPKHSRPQRRYQLDYLGKTTAEWRVIRDFLQTQRLGVMPFEFVHHASIENATFSPTTPVVITLQHVYLTGHWVGIYNATAQPALNNFWPITRLSSTTFSLNGSTGGFGGTCQVGLYLPRAVGVFTEEGDPSPVKLMGPESTSTTRGRFSFQVLIEELL